MSYHILYEATPWHTRCVLFDDYGRPLTVRLQDASQPYTEGAVVLGRVRAVAGSLGSAFVDIGDVQDALLPLSTLPPHTRLTQGQCVLGRIARAGFEAKGARLDARTALKPPADTTCPSLVAPAPTALTRALHDAGANPVTVWINNASVRDVVTQQVPERQIRQLDIDADSAPFDWQEQVDVLVDTVLSRAPTFTFGRTRPQGKGLGTLIVEMTSAVATIDVNAGPVTAMGKDDATLAMNLAAAEDVARLCRLLDLGGSVIVDFITPRSKAHRQSIGEALQATFLTTDDKFVELRPMSRHGLLELTRERIGPSLPLVLKTAPYMAGHIALQLWRTPAGANPKLRSQTVTAAPDVVHVLQKHLSQDLCLRHLGRPVTLKADGALPVERYVVEG